MNENEIKTQRTTVSIMKVIGMRVFKTDQLV